MTNLRKIFFFAFVVFLIVSCDTVENRTTIVYGKVFDFYTGNVVPKMSIGLTDYTLDPNSAYPTSVDVFKGDYFVENIETKAFGDYMINTQDLKNRGYAVVAINAERICTEFHEINLREENQINLTVKPFVRFVLNVENQSKTYDYASYAIAPDYDEFPDNPSVVNHLKYLQWRTRLNDTTIRLKVIPDVNYKIKYSLYKKSILDTSYIEDFYMIHEDTIYKSVVF